MVAKRQESKWQREKPLHGAWLTWPSPDALDALTRAGYDYIGVDCQHSTITLVDAGSLIRPLLGKVPALIRVSANESSLIGKAFDLGADGVIVPMIETAEDAERAVKASVYPLAGNRSFGPIRSELGYDTAELEKRASVFVMLETAEALRNVEAICATPGLTGVYVGPYDLSLGLGTSWLQSPPPSKAVEAINQIARVCTEAGVVAALHAGTGAVAAAWADAGFDMLTLSADDQLLNTAARADLDRARRIADGNAMVGDSMDSVAVES